nr:RecName: Full=33 kDa cell wall protein [Phaseolus vulgaris]
NYDKNFYEDTLP